MWISPSKMERLYINIRGGADKSLARPTSRCRRMESIVSLERGVCSCTELQVFSCNRGWKKACQGRAQFLQHRDASCHQFFFLKGKASKKIHAILTETLGEHASSFATVKNWVVQFKRGDLPSVMRLFLDEPKEWPPRRLLTNSRANLGRPPDFG